MNLEATCIINGPSSDWTFTAVVRDCFKSLVCSKLGAVPDCYIAELSKKFEEIFCNIPDVCLIGVKSDEYFEGSGILKSSSDDESPNALV